VFDAITRSVRFRTLEETPRPGEPFRSAVFPEEAHFSDLGMELATNMKHRFYNGRKSYRESCHFHGFSEKSFEGNPDPSGPSRDVKNEHKEKER
jgi:hypothetical protein